MRISVGLPTFASNQYAIPPSRFRRFARSADEYEFAGAWTIDHLTRPPSYATSMLDPLASLSVVAGETNALPVGTGILVLPLRNPVLVAKRVATIQHLTSRQVTLGLGAGYSQAEFDAVNISREERSARLLEGLELLWRLFHEDAVTFDGEFYSVEDFELEPRLKQPPRILVGGEGVGAGNDRRVLDGVKERMLHAHGWIAPPRPMEKLESDRADIAAYLESRGRATSFHRVAFQNLHLVPGDDTEQARRIQERVYSEIIGVERTVDDSTRRWLTGAVDDVRQHLAEYERLGFDEVILQPVTHDANELDRQLRLYHDLLVQEFP